jgi:hypothetical protein
VWKSEREWERESWIEIGSEKERKREREKEREIMDVK